MTKNELITAITEAILSQWPVRASKITPCRMSGFSADNKCISVGVSNRHIHLSLKDTHTLFGSDTLNMYKKLSQPGQFACRETVTLVGPQGVIENVRVLGPAREKTQVEVLLSDCRQLGIKASIRDSGDLEGSAGMSIVGAVGAVILQSGVIVAARHIHMQTSDARMFQVKDRDKVKILVHGPRGLVFNEVLVRVSDKFNLEMHIDIDEANATGLKNGDTVRLIPKSYD